MRVKIILINVFALLVPFTVLAHPGHGSTGDFTIVHYFKEPVHAIIWVAFLIIGVLFYRKVKLQKNK